MTNFIVTDFISTPKKTVMANTISPCFSGSYELRYALCLAMLALHQENTDLLPDHVKFFFF
jgi:hypothetical protein